MEVKISRYDNGVVKQIHKTATVTTVVGHPYFDYITQFSDSVLSGKVGFVPLGYEHRPDLISTVFYGTPAYWWILMLANNVSDPFEGFNVGDRIVIPNL
jgi:hypothetical protein